jgi:serine/threonine-protein kinase
VALTRVIAARYELGDVLGQGGMSLVYRATDIRLGRTVALKLLREQYAADPEFVQRFGREARAAARLSHANIVAVFDVGSDEDTHYIVMELVEGEDLKALIRREAPLRTDRIVSIGAQMAAALDYAHRHGIVHRDVKPHNILLGQRGEVKVTDFGIAVALGVPSLTQTGVIMGTAQYIAPEQALGEQSSPASDIYSAGVVLFEMATGQVPFQAENLLAVARMHVDRQPPVPSSLNPALPRTLDTVILHALAKEPEARYPSAAELGDALRQHATLGSEHTTRMPLPPTAPGRTVVSGGPIIAGGRRAQVDDPPPNGPSPAAIGGLPPGPPRHVVPRRRHDEGTPAWVLGLMAGVLLAVGLVAIALAVAWLQPAAGPTGPAASPTPRATPTRTLTPRPAAATAAPSATPQPTPTAEPSPTDTPRPTSTVVPTITPTPRPTNTPRPSPTPTPVPPTRTPAPVQVPVVRGMRGEDAREQLERMGFRVQSRGVDSPAPKGIVAQQEPAPGTTLRQGSTVILLVSE